MSSPTLRHSCRRATIGSVEAARRAWGGVEYYLIKKEGSRFPQIESRVCGLEPRLSRLPAITCSLPPTMEAGDFVTADAGAGKVLWSFPANAANWHASPVAYRFDGYEWIAMVQGGNVIVLGLAQ